MESAEVQLRRADHRKQAAVVCVAVTETREASEKSPMGKD